MSSQPPPPRGAGDVYRLPRALRRDAGMPVAPSAPAVPSAVRAFNEAAPGAETEPGDIVDAARTAPSPTEPPPSPAGPPAEPPPSPAGPPDEPVPASVDASAAVTPPAEPSTPPVPATAPEEPVPAPPDTARPPLPPRPAVPRAGRGAAIAGVLNGLRTRPLLLAAIAAAALLALVLAVRGAPTTTLVAQQQTDTAISQARDRAAGGDPQGAVRSLDALVPAAGADARALLRDAEAGILGDAARTAAGRGDAVAALALLRQAARLADTPQGQDAVAALPQGLVDAARQLLAASPTDGSAAALLHQAITAGPGTPAATLAAQLLAAPVHVGGRLTVAGSPGRGLAAALFPAGAPASPAAGTTLTPVTAAATAADGSFDLGVVAPGSYRFGYLDAGHHPHPGPAVTIAPAQVNHLDEALPG